MRAELGWRQEEERYESFWHLIEPRRGGEGDCQLVESGELHAGGTRGFWEPAACESVIGA